MLPEFDRPSFSTETHDEIDENLQFLLDEGLEMLSLYKAIESAQTRLRLCELLRAIVANQVDAPRPKLRQI